MTYSIREKIAHLAAKEFTCVRKEMSDMRADLLKAIFNTNIAQYVAIGGTVATIVVVLLKK
jgi:hypothetical protein